MDRKIRVAAVSYLNTKPLIYGFEKGMMEEEVSLITEFPSGIADLLINDAVDIGLVPIAVLPLLREYHIISNYCIGTEGEVASVCLFSDVPLAEVKTILLDYQSRSSVALLKILLRDHWKADPRIVPGIPGYEATIEGSVAGLVIGDRAFAQRKKNKYAYDLGLAWKELTGLPFVFAAWVANKKLPEDFTSAFNDATGYGLKHLSEVISENPYAEYDLQEYYTNNISYELTDEKRVGMEVFLQKIQYL
ncbi:MAG: menaquinone biosynthesis protein [Ferruginibacter sp.]